MTDKSQNDPEDPSTQNIDTNLTAIIGISIKSFNEKYIDKKTVTFYDIEVTNHLTKNSWIIQKRFNDFKTLHSNLLKLYPNLPQIPSSTFFKVSSEQLLNKRKTDLEIFLRECVQRKEIFLNTEFSEFLEIKKNAPEVLANDVTMVYDYTKLPLGCRNFIIIPHREIMCVCCSDMNIVSRADSMLSNFKLPWENANKKHVPLGAAFIYQCKPDPKEIYKIHKIWAKSFPVQTGVIYWDDKNEIYCIGNDDGRVYCYKAVANTHFLKQNLLCELYYHTDRVMGLALDPYTLNLYSCSTDKSFYVTSLMDPPTYTNILVHFDTVGYTNLEYDLENKRIFLTNEMGQLSVYTTTTFPPNLIKNYQTGSLSCIRAFHLDNKNDLAFTGNVDGRICVISLGKPGKEKLMSQISTFRVGEMKIRVCVHNPNTHELITGDEVGRVIIWNLKTGKPIYLWEAHPKSAITKIWLQVEYNLLWTGGKDMHIKIWQLPEKWVSAEVKEYEENEVSNITAKMVEEKMEKKGEDSDDDDLNGWCFRDY